MARFLVDEDLPRSLARALVAAGHDAVDVRGLDLQGSSDEVVHARAVQEERALVTADLGLAHPIRYPPRFGTILVRLPSTFPAPDISRQVVASLTSVREFDLPNSTIVIEPGRLRVRRHG